MRNLKKMQTKNDGTRTLFESVIYPEIITTLKAWKAANGPGVLIGGLAISYYCKPRMTQDIDFMLLSDDEIPQSGFRKNRRRAFEDLRNNVEIEIVTPSYVGMPPEVCANIIRTAIENDGLKIASPSGLVASKLFRLSMQDKADIVNIINSEYAIDITDFKLPSDKIEKYLLLVIDAEEDKRKVQPIDD